MVLKLVYFSVFNEEKEGLDPGKEIVFNEEKSRGECTTSAGEGLLHSITKL